MISRIKFLTPILVLPCLITPASAQKLKKTDKTTLSNLQAHIRYLADPHLEGRRTGTPGEKAASDYISSALAQAGIQPRGDNNGWLQTFEIDQGREVSRDAFFVVNDHPFLLEKEFFPLALSAATAVSGSPAIALQESGVPWFFDLRELLEANAGNPHFDLPGAIRAKAAACTKKGATALILYNSSRIADNLAFDPHDKPEPVTIPVVYITREAKRKYLKDEAASLDIRLKVGFTEKKRTGHNVVGYLNNGAPTTVVIGAHYDHLGHGEDGNTMYHGKDSVTYTGADDNASGVAGMIELARMLAASRLKGNNYLFVAFSGEEQGLFGSKYLVNHSPVDVKKLNYMINLDMIGRLNDSSHALTLGGFGTSPAWGEICNTIRERKEFTLRLDSSGTGPSDHTSFYLKDVPVLFFFTGAHPDYHMPGDNADKINYPGELQVIKFIYDIVETANTRGRFVFTKTRETSPDLPRFSVTLGILPDYTFSGSGVRADGVSQGRPAEKAGLKAGDVIVQLGSYPVTTMENYMEALGKFKKGDKTTVRYKRGGDTMESPVEF
ncbi:MAG TPA: M20/M25/M40 family metallo-hydrolase [Puia sp.]|nr:M20/M25/M40 family metallo-hydrolase [Puia sp.]